MTLNEFQVKKIDNYLRDNGIESSIIFDDFLDHICCMVEQSMDIGLSFDESLKHAIIELPSSKLKNIEKYTLKLINMETSFSSRISLLATIPFGLFGLYWVLSNAGISVPSIIVWYVLLTAVLSMFILLFLGWMNNFPRWSFPALGFCSLFSLFFMKITIPDLSDGSLGLWALVPLLITLVVCLMFKPSIEPIKKIGKKIKEEPALILFALYGFAPWVISLFTDEIHSNWMVLIDILVIGILSIGLYFFLRTDKKKVRFASIVISALIAGAVVSTASYLFWQ